MHDGPAHVGGQQRHNAVHRRREALNHQVVVEKDGGNLRGVELVLHVVGGLAQLLGFAQVLHVQVHQLLVQALHLLLIGHGLLVGALQLLIGALQLLVGTFELLQAAFHLLDGGLQAVLGVLQLRFEGVRLGIRRIGGSLALAHFTGGGLLLKHHQLQATQGLALVQ